MKQHTIPCRECPFRRTSLRGYLGANRLDHFSTLSMSEEPMPCHTKVDYTHPDWETVQRSSPQCAGRATLWANTCKLPRNPALLRVKPDRTNVFNNIREFIAHHDWLERQKEEAHEER